MLGQVEISAEWYESCGEDKVTARAERYGTPEGIMAKTAALDLLVA
jgi:hypothetical protein